MVLAIVTQHLLLGRAVTLLSLLWVVALIGWLWTYHSIPRLYTRQVRLLYWTALAVQVFHLAEEFFTGLHLEVPALFGYEISDRLFLGFNIGALAVFAVAGIGLMAKSNLAFLAVWAMTAVSLGNGIIHVGLAVGRDGYFPGALTALAHLAVGAALATELGILRSSRAKN